MCGHLADYRGLLGEGCVGVDEESGLIVSVSRDHPGSGAGRVWDYRGRGVIVAPGFIDLHVHLRGLQLSYKEDEASGCKAAAAAGITLVVDMPNTRPQLRDPEALRAKLEALDSKCIVDHGAYAGIPRDPSLASRLASEPIAGFKVYPEDLASPGLAGALATRRLVVLHPELPEASKADLASATLEGRLAHRGCWWEGAAVLELGAHRPRGRVHVTHASCASTVAMARSWGYTVDVTPHHLFLDTTAPLDPCLGRVNPPLRSPGERLGLVKMLLEGRVDALASDHAPHEEREKSLPPTCPPGFPWLEAWPWLAYRLVASGALGLGEFHWLTSRGPALVLGLKRYGALQEGFRANLVAYDPNASWRFPGPRYSKAKLHPATMMELRGRPLGVWVGGAPVYLDGEIVEGRRPGVNPFRAPGAR